MRRIAKTDAQKQLKKAQQETLKRAFETIWRALDGPKLQEEFEFSGERNWRFDYAHPASLVAIELEGGTWIGGRHTRGKGYSEDCQKYNAATLRHWSVFRLTSDMLADSPVGHLLPIIAFIVSVTRYDDEALAAVGLEVQG